MGSNGEQEQLPPKRPFCLRCSKPARLCLCSRLKSPPLDNPIGVTILQHSREKNHPLNSVRVASLGLKNLVVVPVTDVVLRAAFVIRPLNLSCEGELGSSANGGRCAERSDFDEAMLSKAAHEDISDAERTGSSVNSCKEKRYVANGGNVSMGLQKVPFFKTATESNGVVDDGKCSFEKINKCLGQSKVEGSNGVVQMPLFQTHQQEVVSEPETYPTTFREESSTLRKLESQIEELDFDLKFEGVVMDTEDNAQNAGGKCRVTCCPDHLLIIIDSGAKPDLGWALASPIGKAVASNGFIVKKLQQKQLKGSLEFEEHEEFDAVVPPGSALLFPGKKSIGLGEVNFEVKHLIVLDGTWGKARRMYYENLWLQFLPRLRLDTEKASLYSEVRHQPKVGCLSTIESVVCTSKALGSGMVRLDSLLDLFESMILDQRRCKDEKFSQLSQQWSKPPDIPKHGLGDIINGPLRFSGKPIFLMISSRTLTTRIICIVAR